VTPEQNHPANNQEFEISRELPVPSAIIEICQKIENKGGRAYIVGGWVRDMLTGTQSKDFDLEIFGLTKQQLEETLANYQIKEEVGKTFGIYKLTLNTEPEQKDKTIEIDIALARTETSTGEKHKDFTVKTSPQLTPQQTSQRRDFTINALMYDPLQQKLLDFHNGLQDLKERKLYAVNLETFSEDPLRVWRLASLASRLNFADIKTDPRNHHAKIIHTKGFVQPDAFQLCQNMVNEGKLDHLPKERITEEMVKILLKSPHPSIGFTYLQQLGILH